MKEGRGKMKKGKGSKERSNYSLSIETVLVFSRKKRNDSKRMKMVVESKAGSKGN